MINGRKMHDINKNSKKLNDIFEKLIFSKPDFESITNIGTEEIKFNCDQKIYAALIENFSQFAPNSSLWSGGIVKRAELTVQCARESFSTLSLIMSDLFAAGDLVINSIENIKLNDKERAFAHHLEEKFNHYGSDKSTTHDYHNIYAKIISEISEISEGEIKIFEIGLGTNNIDIPSNMGAKGRPGASLRAFRDCLPNAKIYGADIDKSILFEESGIKTFHLDQLNIDVLLDFENNFKNKFDLVIDDGLHSIHANLNTLKIALNIVRPGGYFIIEDIMPATINLWQTMGKILNNQGHSTSIYAGKSAHVFIFRKASLEN